MNIHELEELLSPPSSIDDIINTEIKTDCPSYPFTQGETLGDLTTGDRFVFYTDIEYKMNHPHSILETIVYRVAGFECREIGNSESKVRCTIKSDFGNRSLGGSWELTTPIVRMARL
jgi:hypothetical protein